MQFPLESNQQFYRRLKRTYRNAYGIQIFLKHMSMYRANKNLEDSDYGQLEILKCIILNPMEDEEIKPDEFPPPYKEYPTPVIWIRFCDDTIKEAAQKLIDILQPLDLNNQIVPVLTNFKFENSCLVNDLMNIKDGVLFKEYKGFSFVGSEADVAIVLIENYEYNYGGGSEQIIHQVSRARKLLIICSYKNELELDNFMENSVELGLATQIDFRKLEYYPTEFDSAILDLESY